MVSRELSLFFRGYFYVLTIHPQVAKERQLATNANTTLRYNLELLGDGVLFLLLFSSALMTLKLKLKIILFENYFVVLYFWENLLLNFSNAPQKKKREGKENKHVVVQNSRRYSGI